MKGRMVVVPIVLVPILTAGLFLLSRMDARGGVSSGQALAIAQKTAAVAAFQERMSVLSPACVLVGVVETCDTDYVTCVEDVWVVEWLVDRQCVAHDGRLDLRVLVDKGDGRIRSVYPEAAYFRSEGYCVVDEDCAAVSFGDPPRCRNMIAAYLQPHSPKPKPNTPPCHCLSGKCD